MTLSLFSVTGGSVLLLEVAVSGLGGGVGSTAPCQLLVGVAPLAGFAEGAAVSMSDCMGVMGLKL
jgi:hypothetical protein